MPKKLSILIPTLENRRPYLDRLYSVLTPQLNDQIEILLDIDSGQKTIGEKRNKLISQAVGNYIAFIDDDDLVSFDYITQVLKAIETGPDCIAISLLHFWDNRLHGLTYHSIKYKSWYDIKETTLGVMRYYRCPNHLNPIKKEIALECPFPEISMGEDKSYSLNIRKHLFTEQEIKEPIYYYLFRSQK